MQLTEGLTCLELARRTPGYEAGDLIRFVAQLRMICLTSDSVDSDEEDDPNDVGALKPAHFSIGITDKDSPMFPVKQEHVCNQFSLCEIVINNYAHIIVFSCIIEHMYCY